MSGLIVLDGHDGAGKTTLGKYLVDNFGAIYIHATYRFRDRMDVYHTACLRRMLRHLAKDRLVVMDRWWPSEIAYAGVYRDPMRFNHSASLLDATFIEYGGIYVWCVTSKDAMYRAISSRAGGDPRPEFNVLASEVHDWYNLYAEPDHPNYSDTYLAKFEQDVKAGLRSDFVQYDFAINGVKLDEFCINLVTKASVSTIKAGAHVDFNMVLERYPFV